MCLPTVTFQKYVRFAVTRRDMVESMTATAERIENYELIHGREKVEQFLDAVLSIQEHIDPSIMEPSGPGDGKDDERTPAASQVRKTPYDDLWSLDKSAESNKQLPAAPATFPPKPEKDVLLLLRNTAANWMTGSAIF